MKAFVIPVIRILIIIIITSAAIPGAAQETAVKEPAAKLEKTVFDAAGPNETLLHITHPGRFSIQVTSQQGTRIEIIDRMAGPFASSGSVGGEDGRLDLILDTGSYKIRLISHENGSGQVKLDVFPFREVTPVTDIKKLPYLQDLELVWDKLDDLQQQSFWIRLKERQVLRLEMLGRNLKDARLWRDGNWLEDIRPGISQFAPIPDQPMTHVEFHHDMNPGMYLLTCYGGPAKKWTKETGQYPFYLRMGIPTLGRNGQRLLEISPFGRDVYVVDGKTNFFQLVREEKKPATLSINTRENTKSRYSSIYRSASITKKSRDPWCFIKGSAGGTKQWVIVAASPGEQVELDYFEQRWYCELSGNHNLYWISGIHSVQGRDSIDVTALLTSPDKNIPVKAEVITVTPGEAVIRKVNLLGTIEVFLFVQDGGTYVIEENPNAGAVGMYQFKPFMTSTPGKFKPPPFREAGSDFELTSGYYVLTINPKSKGILHFALHKKANWLSRAVKSLFSKTPSSLLISRKSLQKKQDFEMTPPKERHQADREAGGVADPQALRSLLWPQVELGKPGKVPRYYRFWLNQRADVESGIIVRPLPINLLEPLPVPLEPGQSVMLKVKHKEKTQLKITGGNYQLKVDNIVWDGTNPLSPGLHHLELISRDSKARLFNLETQIMEPYSPPPPPVIKKLEEIFPVLTEEQPLFRDFDYEEKQEFLLRVKEPALYRLETTSRMATGITVRTRTITALFNARQNGIGRNALVLQYFKPGDYLVGVQVLGRSKGRAGIHMRRSALAEITGLRDGGIKRNRVAADAAIRYQVQIEEPDTYHLETYSLGKLLTHRWEDAEGWPLIKPGQPGAINRHFKPGTYFYYSLPAQVESRRVTFLKRNILPPEISGKGPHPLKLNQPLQNLWIEDSQGSPDIYRVELTDPVRADLGITGKMEVEIFSGDRTRDKKVAATSKGKWSGELSPGSYELAATNREKDNRVSYQIHLLTRDLIPGLTQTVDVGNGPTNIPVSLGEDALVDIVSFGNTDIKAVLMDEMNRTIITSADDMPADWNFRVSRNLKAGRYVLAVSSVGSTGGPVELRMQKREEITLPARVLPFSIKKALSSEVIKIPFRTGETESLLSVKVESSNSMKLVLMRDDVLLAEGQEVIFIPLPGQQDYTLLAWDQAEDAGQVRVVASLVKTREVVVTQHQQTIPVDPAAQLRNETGLSFRLTADTPRDKNKTFYYSPALERPCLAIKPGEHGVEGTKNKQGWLVGGEPGQYTRSQVRLETFLMKSGQSIDVVFNELPIALAMDQKVGDPMLLAVRSVNASMGAAVFPFSHPPEKVFTRSGMLAAPSYTLAGIPGNGEYRAHVWLTFPTPPVFSEKNRFDTGERVNLSLTGYPKQGELEFRAAASIETRVEPGQSMWLQLKDEPQLLDLTLARGLVAFSWYQGRAVDITAALDKNRVNSITVKGEWLYVLNTGEQPARFRAEKQGVPTIESTAFDPRRGFESILDIEGTLGFQLPQIPGDMKLMVAGTRVTAQVWGSDGKIYNGIEQALRKNFHLEYYGPDVSGGFLEIRHGPGLVKVWLALVSDNGASFMGDKETAVPAVFREGMGQLTLQPQVWEFKLENSSYVSLETLEPTALFLMSGRQILYMSASAFRGGHQLNHYLPAGTYHLWTRLLTGTEPPGAAGNYGNLLLKIIIPTVLEEGRESEMQIIRPGEIQVFSFSVEAEGAVNVGVGLKTESDSLEAQVFDEQSRLVSTGPLMVKELSPGTYLMVVKTRDIPVQYRPMLLGAKGSREGVPHEVIQNYQKEEEQ